VADTVYVTYIRTDRGFYPDHKPCLAVTGGVTTLLSQIPPEVKVLFEQREHPESAAGSFRFTVERPCHGCEWDVWVQLNNRKRHVLKVSSPNVVADSDRPVLFYEAPGYLNAIGSLNLLTQKLSELPLPTGGGDGATKLLAAKRVQGGFLMAYATGGECAPELNPGGSPSWAPPWVIESLKQPPKPKRICFARFPDSR
jgi:hypothetical protein